MRGKAATTDSPVKTWEVVRTRIGGHIHGARREVGDMFDAPESAVAFDVLEGLIVEHRPKAEKKPKAEA